MFRLLKHWFGERKPPELNDDAKAFWQQAEADALNTGVAASSRHLYARLAAVATEVGDSKAIPDKIPQDVQRLLDCLRKENPRASIDQLQDIAEDEMRGCIRYWEDGTPADTAVIGLRILLRNQLNK